MYEIRIYYGALLVLSMICSAVYAMMWHKHFSASFSLIYTLVPIAVLSYALQAWAVTEAEVMLTVKMIYLGGCFLPYFLLLNICDLCQVKLPKWVRVVLLLASMVIYLSVQSIGNGTVFYRSFSIAVTEGRRTLVKEYGPMHTVFYGLTILYFLLSLGTILYSFARKKEVSRKIIWYLFIPEVVTMICFFGGRMVTEVVEFTPAAYVLAQIMYLLIVYRICLYDVSETAIDSLMETGKTGFISFDFRLRYLGSNATARKIYPELTEMTVDRKITRNQALAERIMPWIEKFREDENSDTYHDRRDDRIYLVGVNYLYDRDARKGFQLVITDDTETVKYKELLENYNSDLSRDVKIKTDQIVQMHEGLLKSMAVLVESRDDSTGGHILRTSEVVRILMDEIMADRDFTERYGITEQFREYMRKAAPLHDLGKIAVPDMILKKKGRFTPEEFEEMKRHAPEGAKVLRRILKAANDPEFNRLAENVAHYHHERMDGSGYPNGLKGETIPIEARIMAVADVYDALVSKRVYKEKMPFDQADGIMMESMGRHFDPQLEKFYVAARPRIEDYYRGLDE